MNSDFDPYFPASSLESEFRELTLRRQKECPPKEHQQNSWLRQLQSALLNFLTGAQTVSIREVTKAGSTQWIVYDSFQDIRTVFSSQQAVRVWLEQKKNS